MDEALLLAKERAHRLMLIAAGHSKPPAAEGATPSGASPSGATPSADVPPPPPADATEASAVETESAAAAEASKAPDALRAPPPAYVYPPSGPPPEFIPLEPQVQPPLDGKLCRRTQP